MKDLIRHILKEETEDEQIKYLKKYYDVEVSSDKIGKKIHTLIKFIPKDTDNEMTPSVVTSWGLWTDKGNGRLDFEDCAYVRNWRMPLLNYIPIQYNLDNYVERLHRQEAKKRIS